MFSVRLSVVLVIVQLFFTTCTSKPEFSETVVKAHVIAAFENYVKHVNKLNSEGIAACISDNKNFFWVEDGSLKYVDKASLLAETEAFLPLVKSTTMIVDNMDVQVLNPKYASVFAEYKKNIYLNSGEEFRFDGNMTVLLVKENGNWTFLSGHSSHKNLKDDYQALEKNLQKELDSIVKQNDLPGITFSILFDNGQQINLAAGYQDLEQKIPMQPETRMLAGSIGKMFISAIALKLVQQNRLGLQEQAIAYLGNREWFKAFPNHEDIKIINLLNHTSGLPDYLYQDDFLEEFKQHPRKERNHDEGIRFLANQPAVHPVGKGWAYSDTNYILLGLIIEQITSEDVFKTIENEFIVPLKLSLTIPSDKLKLEGLPQGYLNDFNPFQLPPKSLDKDGLLVVNPTIEWAAGGLISNPMDLTKFIKYLYESDYLNNETKELWLSPVNLETGMPDTQGYGLGIFIYERNGDMKYGHSGYFPGYLSHVEYSVEHKYFMAIQTNKNMENGMQQLQDYSSRLISAMPPPGKGMPDKD